MINRIKGSIILISPRATRTATITGIPEGVRELRMWVTDAERGMQEVERVAVNGGKAQLALPATSYTTVIGTQEKTVSGAN